VLPENGKENTLQTIGQNLGLQTTEKEAPHARFLQYIAHNLAVGQLIWMGLLVHLDDPDGIGARVTDSGTAETENGTTTKFLELIVLLRDLFTQIVVGEEPWVVTDKGGRCRSEGAIVETEICIICENINCRLQSREREIVSVMLSKHNAATCAQIIIISITYANGPLILTLSTTLLNFPVTCMVVLTVSTGIKKMRHTAAAADADTVLRPTLRLRVDSYESIKVSIPVLAAVSPNRDRGP
jgi:hypothetical protein